MTTYIEAVNSMNKQVFDAWIANYASVTGLTVPSDGLKNILHYEGQENKEEPLSGYLWGRISFRTIEEERASLRNSEGESTYKNTGLIIVQIFCPRSFLNSVTKARELATITRNALRGQNTCEPVWFKRAKILPLPVEADYLRYNVMAEYEFYERV